MSDPFDPGTIVADRDEETNTQPVVINCPPATADEWHVDGRGTVAADNPDYPADDPVVIVMFRDWLEEQYPLFSGGALPLSELNVRGVPFYAFPVSRLREVGELEAPEIPIHRIQPSPYHVRTFDAEANREFIDEIADQGEPPGPPLVRVLEENPLQVELLNGHKRTWASAVAGLETIPVWAMYHVDDEEAARIWINRHLETYTPAQQRRAFDRLKDRFGRAQAQNLTANIEAMGGEPA